MDTAWQDMARLQARPCSLPRMVGRTRAEGRAATQVLLGRASGGKRVLPQRGAMASRASHTVQTGPPHHSNSTQGHELCSQHLMIPGVPAEPRHQRTGTPRFGTITDHTAMSVCTGVFALTWERSVWTTQQDEGPRQPAHQLPLGQAGDPGPQPLGRAKTSAKNPGVNNHGLSVSGSHPSPIARAQRSGTLAPPDSSRSRAQTEGNTSHIQPTPPFSQGPGSHRETSCPRAQSHQLPLLHVHKQGGLGTAMGNLGPPHPGARHRARQAQRSQEPGGPLPPTPGATSSAHLSASSGHWALLRPHVQGARPPPSPGCAGRVSASGKAHTSASVTGPRKVREVGGTRDADFVQQKGGLSSPGVATSGLGTAAVQRASGVPTSYGGECSYPGGALTKARSRGDPDLGPQCPRTVRSGVCGRATRSGALFSSPTDLDTLLRTPPMCSPPPSRPPTEGRIVCTNRHHHLATSSQVTPTAAGSPSRPPAESKHSVPATSAPGATSSPITPGPAASPAPQPPPAATAMKFCPSDSYTMGLWAAVSTGAALQGPEWVDPSSSGWRSGRANGKQELAGERTGGQGAAGRPLAIEVYPSPRVNTGDVCRTPEGVCQPPAQSDRSPLRAMLGPRLLLFLSCGGALLSAGPCPAALSLAAPEPHQPQLGAREKRQACRLAMAQALGAGWVLRTTEPLWAQGSSPPPAATTPHEAHTGAHWEPAQPGAPLSRATCVRGARASLGSEPVPGARQADLQGPPGSQRLRLPPPHPLAPLTTLPRVRVPGGRASSPLRPQPQQVTLREIPLRRPKEGTAGTAELVQPRSGPAGAPRRAPGPAHPKHAAGHSPRAELGSPTLTAGPVHAGLDDSSLVPPGLQRLKDSPQTDPRADGAIDPNHNKGLRSPPDRGWCSTWGASHFSTFDGHVYDFSGTCNYIFAAMCKDASSTFSVQLRRGPSGNISRVIVELGASVVTVEKAVVSVKDVGVASLPYSSNGLQITPFGQSVRLVAKQLELELVVMWGPGTHLMVLVEKKHMGKMCGLCGNFDGEKTNEFLSEDGQLLEPPKYAALQKLDDPSEICAYEAVPSPRVLQAGNAQTCIQLLTLVSPECNVPKEPFLLSCQADMATCAQPGRHNCSCATLSEYSRQCSMAGQPVNSWRGPGLCSVGQCPANQVYRECGETCVRTCSNPQHSCSSFCTFGCFCPEGMVLDDISKNHSCVPVPQCPCMLSGVVYAPGEVTTAACQTCRCSGGHWKCVERPCPRRCALEGGSFVTTFDARPYRFHGTCTYILLQSPQLPDGGSLMAVYDQSGYSRSETSLAAVIYMSSQDKIVISQDEVVTNNRDTKWLPYKTRNITVFRQTSTHIQMVTTFGLELVIQLWPVFQVYITVGPQFRGQTRGLCGNFNGDTTDDFTTSVGIAEGTASLFVDSWRAGNCPAALERETDPCSMSQLNKVCAETHCAVLVEKGTVFEKCHAAVDPKPFYKRCVYQACNYEETFPHICAALGDYALACTSRGVLLQGWRSSVDNCSTPCTGNQTFSYDSQACDRTCLSLSDREAECHPSAVPVDGCNCPEGTYLNHKTECVRKAQCPCLLDGSKFILADQSTMVNGVICYCVNGRLSCPAQPQMLLATCSAPKTFQSCSRSSEDKFGAACAPTCQMLATGTPCVPTKCEPGCVCAKGLYENANGQCVPPEECPCEFAGVSYPKGAELHTDCKSCICSRGTWTCQQSAHCPSTCTLYGEGHVVTFDGQRFVFDGNCEYILATDSCGASDSQPTFKILTENVVCGKSGVTCSRAIKIFLGGLSIVLADRNYTVSGEDPSMHFRVKASSLHLVLDATISSTYHLTLIWNKHMTVFIKIARASQDALCGLCGNYNGNMKDDFQTRSKYLASSELEFVNSWKESPLCGDTTFTLDPCSLNTFRRSWAERKCAIINSQTFAACHGQVYRLPYYEACVRDACGCDAGGDCECLCDAVAAYAQACLDKGVCVDWRSPDFCPIYCDFYNTHTQVGGGKYQYAQEANCTWHYQPCLCPEWPQSVPGANIEGCYNCSQNEYFDHDKGMCLPCSLPGTETRPTTATASTTVTPSTTGLSSPRPSPSSPATPEAPTRTPSLPATATAPTTRTQPTFSSGGKAPGPGPRGG
ncbi:mucin-6-like [Megaptera novaeangliae]